MSKDVPEIAVKWLEDVFDHKKKLKWYFERSADSHSYEAKFIRKGKKFSVEFSEIGFIEDIEVIDHWRKLPHSVRDNISDYMDDLFIKSRIEKIQIQYTGSKEDLQNWVQTDFLNQIVVKYEVEFYGQSPNTKKLWEGLFDKDGHILMKREILLSPSNNLFY
ncbi:hypothetical protein CQA01_11140 [Cyclobacterium qasimii]|uniref:Uncharacterized protein n=3 Tax=Cyclobacterium qasimii TaxID=1350429 RepID=A0A512C8T2_9BACT|nr:hypothetical protein CQA01_11140 [Cyclobacterium qasimii]